MFSLQELLPLSDVVLLHAPGDPENDGLIGEAELAAMRPGAVLINSARGNLVDEAALLRDLESGHLSGAALDVLAGEPGEAGWLNDHPLVALARRSRRLLLTPHIGGASRDSGLRAEAHVLDLLEARWKGKRKP